METVVKTYGINTFKHFMAYKGALMVDDDELFDSFSRCAELGAMPLVHAENGDVVLRSCRQHYIGQRRHRAGGPCLFAPARGRGRGRQPRHHDRRHGGLRRSTSCTPPAARRTRRSRAPARAASASIGEPLIQHLVLDESEYLNTRLGPCGAARDVAAVPPQGAPGSRSGPGCSRGSLQVVATDHCAFTDEQKRMGRSDFRKIPNGTGGLEDRMPVLWTAGVNTGRLTREEFVAVTSANIARILNIYPRKGAVAVGSDADLVIFDPAATKTISAKNQISRIEYNVFEGRVCNGAPVATIANGKLAWRPGEMRAASRRRPLCRAAAVSRDPCGQHDLARRQRAARRRARRRDAMIP